MVPKCSFDHCFIRASVNWSVVGWMKKFKTQNRLLFLMKPFTQRVLIFGLLMLSVMPLVLSVDEAKAPNVFINTEVLTQPDSGFIENLYKLGVMEMVKIKLVYLGTTAASLLPLSLWILIQIFFGANLSDDLIRCYMAHLFFFLTTVMSHNLPDTQKDLILQPVFMFSVLMVYLSVALRISINTNYCRHVKGIYGLFLLIFIGLLFSGFRERLDAVMLKGPPSYLHIIYGLFSLNSFIFIVFDFIITNLAHERPQNNGQEEFRAEE